MLSAVSERWMRRFAAPGRPPRAVAGIACVVLCLLIFCVGPSPALCLDPRGNCSPLSADGAGSCHDEAERDLAPRCDSCVDVPVPDDSASRWGRPDDDLRPPAVAHLPVFAREVPQAFSASDGAATPLAGALRLPARRPGVLRI